MDTNSTPEAAAERKPKPKGRIRKFLLRSVLALIVALTVAHFVWKNSGSSQWEKVGERNGVTVYAMKTPGTPLKKFKAVWKIRSKVSRFVMWASDQNPDPKYSMRAQAGHYDHRIIEEHGDLRATWSTWKQPFGKYLTPRQFVVRVGFSQNPVTKTLLYAVTGEPEKIPLDDCCVRVPVMTNRWTVTPLKTGELEVEWFIDMDLGGAVPYVMQNAVLPKGLYRFPPRVQMLLDQERYKNAQYSWIQEPEVEQVVAAAR